MHVTLVQCFQYDHESKLQNLQQKQPTSPHPRQLACRNHKENAHHSLPYQSIVHFEFIPRDQTVNQAYYVETVKRRREAVRNNGPELWPNELIVQQNDAPAHRAFFVKQFLAQKSITETEHPPCAPDLATNDFWLFPERESALKGRRYQDTADDILKNVTRALKAIPQQQFQKCFQQWQHRRAMCIAILGEYFEGDPSKLSCNYTSIHAIKPFRELHSRITLSFLFLDPIHMPSSFSQLSLS
jgi:hypothetical protein